jgi:hypothetical protein
MPKSERVISLMWWILVFEDKALADEAVHAVEKSMAHAHQDIKETPAATHAEAQDGKV